MTFFTVAFGYAFFPTSAILKSDEWTMCEGLGLKLIVLTRLSLTASSNESAT